MAEIFDDWADKYDLWFQRPLGRLIKDYESELVLRMLRPAPGEMILDAGCGTGIFTTDILQAGARVMGLEPSLNMLGRALTRCGVQAFHPVCGDLRRLPFSNNSFHKTVSLTAIEFISEAGRAMEEMFRVTKPGGHIVAATLNRLSPWASGRIEAARKGHPLFKHAVFRSPEELLGLSTVEGTIQTAIHFQKDTDPDMAPEIEEEGRERQLKTGAFLVAGWVKPN